MKLKAIGILLLILLISMKCQVFILMQVPMLKPGAKQYFRPEMPLTASLPHNVMENGLMSHGESTGRRMRHLRWISAVRWIFPKSGCILVRIFRMITGGRTPNSAFPMGPQRILPCRKKPVWRIAFPSYVRELLPFVYTISLSPGNRVLSRR